MRSFGYWPTRSCVPKWAGADGTWPVNASPNKQWPSNSSKSITVFFETSRQSDPMLDTRLSENSAAGSRVTPLLLTFNEEPNLDRVLRALTWAKEVGVVDYGSTYRTVE